MKNEGWRMNLLSISPPQRGRLSEGEGKTKNEEGRMENEEKTFPLLHFRGKNNLLSISPPRRGRLSEGKK